MNITAMVNIQQGAVAKVQPIVLVNGEGILELVADAAQDCLTYSQESKLWAVGTVEEQPLGSAKHWAELAHADSLTALESGQVAFDSAKVATTKATEATASADAATQKADEATTAADTATAKATEAVTAAATATDKAGEAVTAATTAASAANTASTAAASAESWAVGNIIDQPAGSAKYWAEKAAESGAGSEKIELLATTSYLTWNGSTFVFASTPPTVGDGKYPTVQVGFVNSNTTDSPTITVGGVAYPIYVAGRQPKAGELTASDTCFVVFKSGRADVFALDPHTTYAISGNPLDTVLPTEKAVKTYVDTTRFITAAQGQGVWYYVDNTTISTTKPTTNVTIPFSLSGTTTATKTFTGTFPVGGFYSPTASYIKNIHLTGLQGSTTYNITFSYSIKGTQIWTTTQSLTTANGQTIATLTINVPSESTYGTRINWVAGDNYTETLFISKTTTGNNHTVNLIQTPASSLYSFMQRNGGVIYTDDVFDGALNRTQNDINSGLPTTTVSTVGGVVTLNYLTSKMFKHTATSSVSIALSNMPTNMTNVMGLELTNGGLYTITHPTGCKFAGGTAPQLTASGKDILLYMYDGTDVFCNVLKDVK